MSALAFTARPDTVIAFAIFATCLTLTIVHEWRHRREH